MARIILQKKKKSIKIFLLHIFTRILMIYFLHKHFTEWSLLKHKHLIRIYLTNTYLEITII